MANTWLTPGGDLAPALRGCRVPPVDRSKPEILADVELAVGVAVDQVEAACGSIADPAPAWAVGAALIIAEHYFRTRLGATRVDTSPGSGSGYLIPKAAVEILEPHTVPLGFA